MHVLFWKITLVSVKSHLKLDKYNIRVFSRPREGLVVVGIEVIRSRRAIKLLGVAVVYNLCYGEKFLLLSVWFLYLHPNTFNVLVKALLKYVKNMFWYIVLERDDENYGIIKCGLETTEYMIISSLGNNFHNYILSTIEKNHNDLPWYKLNSLRKNVLFLIFLISGETEFIHQNLINRHDDIPYS